MLGENQKRYKTQASQAGATIHILAPPAYYLDIMMV